MGVKAVLIDVSNTTIDRYGRVVPGIKELTSFSRQQGIKVVFLCNLPKYSEAIEDSGLEYDLLATPANLHAFKPSPKVILAIEELLGISRHEFLYLGDSDFTDAHCAARENILFFMAHWANKQGTYGISVPSPRRLQKHLGEYLIKDHYWWWQFEGDDKVGRPMHKYALLNMDDTVKGVSIRDMQAAALRHRRFFLSHLTASVYLSGLYRKVDFWATYPGHPVAGRRNPSLLGYLSYISREFSQKHVDLFQLLDDIDTDAETGGCCLSLKDAAARFSLNSNLQRNLIGKCVLLVDGYSTTGYASEWARNLVYEAGAREVIVCTLAKSQTSLKQISIRSRFDPFSRVDVSKLEYEEADLEGVTDTAAGVAVRE